MSQLATKVIAKRSLLKKHGKRDGRPIAKRVSGDGRSFAVSILLTDLVKFVGVCPYTAAQRAAACIHVRAHPNLKLIKLNFFE